MTPAGWRATDHHVDLGGDVHYVDFGGPSAPEAPRVVFVHGLGGSHRDWGLIGPTIAAHARAYALDLPGFGLSYPAGRSGGVRANVTVLSDFLRAVVGGPALLIGNSMGALISMLYASADPDAVTGLVLIDPVLPRAPGAPLDKQITAAFAVYALPVIGERFLARRRATISPKVAVRDTLALVCADPSRLPSDYVTGGIEAAEARAAAANDGTAPGLDKAFLQAARSVLTLGGRRRTFYPMAGALAMPVLLIHGEKDRLVPIASARLVAARCPQWRFEPVEDAGHCPQLEVPEVVASLILDWMGADAPDEH